MNVRNCTICFACWIWLILPAVSAASDAAETTLETSNQYALLIGCSRYPHLPDHLQLKGPENDVRLLKRLLIQKFQVPEQQIATLSESSGAENLPTYENIQRAFQNFKDTLQPGNSLTIFMAGHGTQQPDETPPDPNDPEPDGMDEVFLPRDVKGWEDTGQTIENAIPDDLLHEWLRGLQQKGIHCWIFFDSCHSGTMTRNGRGEMSREIPAREFVPESVLEQSRQQGSSIKTSGSPAQQLRPGAASKGKLVAVFASQADQPTIETQLPAQGEQRQHHGLFTYTLCRVLQRAKARLTYRELVQEIHAEYVRQGRFAPTPLLEGTNLDLEVFGLKQWPDRSAIRLSKTETGEWKINTGELHGLGPGSLLEVFPPVIQGSGTAEEKKRPKSLGIVRVLEQNFSPFEAMVAPHTEPKGNTVDQQLIDGARCEVRYVDCGDHQLTVALHPDIASTEAASQLLNPTLRELAAKDYSAVILVENPKRADWLINLTAEPSRRLLLEPGNGWGTESNVTHSFGPIPLQDSERVKTWLDDSLRRIARGKRLLELSGNSQLDSFRGQFGLEMECRLFRYKNLSDRMGTEVQWTSTGIEFQDGELIGFQVRNPTFEQVDVTLLFIDSGFGISPLVSRSFRLGPRQSMPVKRARIRASTTGLEHLVVIAVVAQPQQEPQDFTFLAQPTIEKARQVSTNSTRNTGLGQLLQSALYQQGKTRGLETSTIDQFRILKRSWSVIPTSDK